jgi:hypothetical protein
MTQAVVELLNFRDANSAGTVLDKPFPESVVKGSVFGAGDLARAFDGGFVCAESDVLHNGLAALFNLVARKLLACLTFSVKRSVRHTTVVYTIIV